MDKKPLKSSLVYSYHSDEMYNFKLLEQQSLKQTITYLPTKKFRYLLTTDMVAILMIKLFSTTSKL